jgi:hypothetical protein
MILAELETGFAASFNDLSSCLSEYNHNFLFRNSISYLGTRLYTTDAIINTSLALGGDSMLRGD